MYSSTSPVSANGLPTLTIDDAIERVHWYTCRWTIEVWHRILKSCCCIESCQLETVERLIVALTLYSIVAWRILHATMLARIDTELPCTVLLSDEEWQALFSAPSVCQIPLQPPSLAEVILWIAKLGGFLARRGDGAPGPQVFIARIPTPATYHRHVPNHAEQ